LSGSRVSVAAGGDEKYIIMSTYSTVYNDITYRLLNAHIVTLESVNWMVWFSCFNVKALLFCFRYGVRRVTVVCFGVISQPSTHTHVVSVMYATNIQNIFIHINAVCRGLYFCVEFELIVRAI
jgi:hypothetical protein